MNKGSERNRKNWDDNMREDEDLKQNCGKQGLDTHPVFRCWSLKEYHLAQCSVNQPVRRWNLVRDADFVQWKHGHYLEKSIKYKKNPESYNNTENKKTSNI